MSRTFMECVSPEACNLFLQSENEPETHRKLFKRLRHLAGITDQDDLRRALDDIQIFKTLFVGTRMGIAPVRPGQQTIHESLRRILMFFSENERSGTPQQILSRLRLPRDNEDEGQIPQYTSILYIQNFRVIPSRPYDFYWFLSKQKSLIVITTPFLGYTQTPAAISAMIDEYGLWQKFAPCAYCEKTIHSVALCCSKTWYCNKACQKAGWPSHKAVCTRTICPDQSTDPLHDMPQTLLHPTQSQLSLENSSQSSAELLQSTISELCLRSNESIEMCVVCGATGSLKACKCRTLYCGIACRDSDWPKHKKLCKKLHVFKTCLKCKAPTDGTVCLKCALK